MSNIKISYLTFGLENGHGANSTSEFIRLARNDERLDVTVITERRLIDFSIKRLGQDIKTLLSSDLIHYVPRVHHLIFHPLLFLVALFTRKIVLDLRSVNIQSGLNFHFQCYFVNLIAMFSKHICGNLGAPRSYGLTCDYTNIPIGVDTIYLSDAKPVVELSAFDQNQTNLLYVGSFNKTRHFDKFLENFQFYSDQRMLKLHVIGDAPVELVERFPNINFLGRHKKEYIFRLLEKYEFITICYMAAKNHDLAPAIKLLEYSYFNQKVLVSKTPGLLAQAQQIGLQGQVFVDQFDEHFWSTKFSKLSLTRVKYKHIATYSEIFTKLVVPMYERLLK